MQDEDHPGRQAQASSYKSKGGLVRTFAALRYAAQGLRAAWQFEAAFRHEFMLGSALFLVSFWIAPSLLFGVLMNASILLVWCMEMVNSAIEALADAVSVEPHPLLGRAKDLGSAAVLLSFLLAGGIWAAAIYARFLL